MTMTKQSEKVGNFYLFSGEIKNQSKIILIFSLFLFLSSFLTLSGQPEG